jgi:hypothetical protein
MVAFLVIAYEMCSNNNSAPIGANISGFANPSEEEEGEYEPVMEEDPKAYTHDSEFMKIDNEESARIDIPGCPGNSASFISSNLLPKDTAQLDTSFAEFSPANLKGENFLDSTKYQIGMQSQALRNANLQLRADPVIPKDDGRCVWNTSTIGPENTPAGNHLAN